MRMKQPIAAMCAGAQDHFWPMHDSLFATQPNGNASPIHPQAFAARTSVGVNVPRTDRASRRPIAALVAGDQERAQRGGVEPTPSFCIGSRLVEGAVPAARDEAPR